MSDVAGSGERLEFLSAVLLVSEEPARLAAFYRDVLGVPLEGEQHGGSLAHWGCNLGDLHFAIHPIETFPDGRCGVGAVKLAFTVFDLAAFLDGLRARGVTLLREPVDTGYFLSALLEDPDGNVVELTQLGADWFELLAKRRARGEDVIERFRRSIA